MAFFSRLQILFSVILVSCTVAKGQDLVVKMNGDSIEAKILEVGVSTVTYKKSSLPNGPVFTENKSDVRLIKLGNGEVQEFNKASAIPTESLVLNAGETPAAGKPKIELINGEFFGEWQVVET